MGFVIAGRNRLSCVEDYSIDELCELVSHHLRQGRRINKTGVGERTGPKVFSNRCGNAVLSRCLNFVRRDMNGRGLLGRVGGILRLLYRCNSAVTGIPSGVQFLQLCRPGEEGCNEGRLITVEGCLACTFCLRFC